MNTVNPFPALAAPRQLIFLSNLPSTDKAALVANLSKTSLAKGAAKFISASLPKLPYSRQLRFTKFYIH